MQKQKYSVNQYLVESLLNWVKSGEIAIPEIQRPFVWTASRVRDFMDSLYKGYPVGYVIAWRNPDVRTKDGKTASGKKILIDGQQRITALRAAILGEPVLNKHYEKGRITIAFHPLHDKFEVSNPAIRGDAQWIPDIAQLVSGHEGLLQAHPRYMQLNPSADPDKVGAAMTNLTNIAKRQVGMIELEHDLDIEEVTEIFIRINSKGVVLSQADFAMSKIAAETRYDGPNLRKAIDYFCHMAVSPEIHDVVVSNDAEFANTNYYNAIRWMREENDDLYDPSYVDVMRVAFTSEFNRGRLADLVSLLSGRNFEARTYEEEIAADSFKRLGSSFMRLANETNFKRFLMIIRSAGFIRPHMIRSRNAINFAYIVFLKLRALGHRPEDIERFVRRWFVMGVLTERSSGAFETRFESDIKAIATRDFAEVLATVEAGSLSDAFWEVSLVESLSKSSTNSPIFWAFIASQVKAGDMGFLSRDIRVSDLVELRGDIHHIFPKDYLKKNGFKRGDYNQLSNFVYMQTEINIGVGNKAPRQYFGEIVDQASGGKRRYGNIASRDELTGNLAMHAIPESVVEMDISDYADFLSKRRRMMSAKMRAYYESL
ncbi:hypothetical protein N792_05395 [Lysobacter concretionis Ko07 = DSM 16239]|uniref:GmrSD restriction endonucleases N-terminal domain-containing protein n=1 Tax=Lysobacter concretionis Ko07 = DSM 16239 TaxID=1122185 RepID=A0A0A0ETL7_9GAMM|nr:MULTISPECIES: DUF262 domain-containing protein [Lysobacter]KGM52502.1 hypothetical protein N792_05395 [Lysobacter concretionis Ko07 = DSM 16239]QOD91744.1 DUF262 domain-containing protein [Lysobacter sp. CW239]